MKRNEAIHAFWNSFGLPAYRDTAVPDDVTLPYLTYQYAFGGFNRTMSTSVSMWFYTESEADPDEYADALNDALKDGGAKVIFDDGAVVFTRGTPFCIAQRGDNDSNLKLRFFNINATFDN